jgi:acetyl-CoA C-acetyltransferase
VSNTQRTGPRIAIVGVGQSVHAPRRDDVAHGELALEAIQEALVDAGVALSDIDNSVTASMDFWDGRTIASMAISEVVGSYLKSEARVCSDGIQALMYEWTRLAAGGFRLGLVVGHLKESEGRPHDIEAAAFEPYVQRRLDADGDVVAGLTAQRYYAVSGHGPQDAAAAVVAARRAARGNPKLAPLAEVDAQDVLTSAPLSSPLRQLDKAPLADGSCAFVVAVEDVAAQLDADPVWITGLATSNDEYWSDRDLAAITALEQGNAKARQMAGWDSSAPDLIEYSAQFGFQLLQFAPGVGADALDPARVNPSGGRMAGNPLVVAGLSRVAECVTQLRGRAADRQLSGVNRALAHGISGIGAQSHALVALEGGA